MRTSCCLGAFALLGAAALLLGGCNRHTQLTLDNYNKITEGMDLADVQKLLGGPGEEDTELGMAEGSSVAGAVGIGGDLASMTPKKSPFKTYRWGSSSRWIKVNFLNGKVAPAANAKQSEGLR